MTNSEWTELVKVVAWRTKSDYDRAEDALQTAYLEMLAKGEPILNERAFLITVAKRRMWDRLQKETFLPMAYAADGIEDPLEGVAGGAGDPACQFIGEKNADLLLAIAEGMTISEAATHFGVSRPTIYKYLKEWGHDRA